MLEFNKKLILMEYKQSNAFSLKSVNLKRTRVSKSWGSICHVDAHEKTIGNKMITSSEDVYVLDEASIYKVVYIELTILKLNIEEMVM